MFVQNLGDGRVERQVAHLNPNERVRVVVLFVRENVLAMPQLYTASGFMCKVCDHSVSALDCSRTIKDYQHMYLWQIVPNQHKITPRNWCK